MKWHALKPLVLQFACALALYIGAPLTLIFTNWIDVNVKDSVGAGFVVIGILLYIYFIVSYLIPGASSLFDLLTNNFKTENMIFISGYIDKSRFLIFNRKKDTVGNLDRNEYCFFRTIFANQTGKSVYNTTCFYRMDEGKPYTVQYGKFSKVIISITSVDGEEMLAFHAD